MTVLVLDNSQSSDQQETNDISGKPANKCFTICLKWILIECKRLLNEMKLNPMISGDYTIYSGEQSNLMQCVWSFLSLLKMLLVSWYGTLHCWQLEM